MRSDGRLLTLAALSAWACAAPAPSPALPRSAPEPPPVEAGIPSAPGEYDLAADVLHYDVELSLGDSRIAGRATLTVRANGGASLPLDFTGLAVSRVHVDGRPADFDYEQGKLTVPLAGADSDAQIVVDYEGTPDDGLILGNTVHGTPSAFVDNWPNRTRFWLPSVDHPADKATATFAIHAPRDWQVIANGAQVGDPTPAQPGGVGSTEGKMTWRWATRVAHPSYTLVVGATRFAIEALGRAACGNAPASPDADGCVEVSFWVYPEDVAFARRVFRRAPEMVDHFTRVIGPYPFEKLANVQSATRFGGMENSSAIFYSEQAIAAGRLGEGTVSHEIAHQWFGDSATEGEWSHLWLSEGFATYFGAQFFEEAEGVDDFRRRMEENRQGYLASDDVNRPIVDPGGARNLFDLLNRNNYAKGGWVLHMLRGVLGDDAFFEGIRSYYQRFAYGNAMTSDLADVFAEVSGRSLDWFFEQWVFQPGYPILASDWSLSPDGSELVLTVAQTQAAEWPTFRIPLEVEVAVAGERKRQRIEITQRSQTFRFPADGQPDSVTLDPDGWVLKG